MTRYKYKLVSYNVNRGDSGPKSHFLGTQQSSAEIAALSTKSLASQLDDGSESSSPKSFARASQMLAILTSFSDKPCGLCVVQRMKVVL
jgi:hypothetical protein